VTQSGEADGVPDETLIGAGGGQLTDRDSRQDESVLAPGVSRQLTGDDAVDEVLEQFDAVTDEPLDTQIAVGERVHRVLQGRLADLGKV